MFVYCWFLVYYRYLRAALLPNSLTSIRTKAMSDFQKPVFNDTFAVPISLSKLLTKSLHVTVVSMTGQKEEIIVSFFNLKNRKRKILIYFFNIYFYRVQSKLAWLNSILRIPP